MGTSVGNTGRDVGGGELEEAAVGLVEATTGADTGDEEASEPPAGRGRVGGAGLGDGQDKGGGDGLGPGADDEGTEAGGELIDDDGGAERGAPERPGGAGDGVRSGTERYGWRGRGVAGGQAGGAGEAGGVATWVDEVQERKREIGGVFSEGSRRRGAGFFRGTSLSGARG